MKVPKYQKLFEQLHLLDERVLYYDTDSIIYISRSDEYEPELGDYLGDFTNEIDGDAFITAFVSAGAKNYAYKTSNGETLCKVKGLTLNYGANKIVNFESMKSHVLGEIGPLEVEQNKFIRNKNEWTIKTEEMKKIYRQIYDKRILKSDLTTLPYGY